MAAPSNNKPQQPEVPLLTLPPAPAVSNLPEVQMMSPEQQAAMARAWQNFRLRPAPAVDVPSGFQIIVPDPPAQSEDWTGKQPPTAEERASLRNDSWK